MIKLRKKTEKRKLLVTGGAGFVGHHVIEHFLKNTDWKIIVIDRLSYSSGGFDRLRDIKFFKKHSDRVNMFTHDFTKPVVDGLAKEIGQVDYILHMGAESHVDNSILNPEPFVLSNVLGTMHLLNFARAQSGLRAFVYFSTDEVFGPAPGRVNYKEWDRYKSGNPYAATKAGGEELAIAFANTYRIPVIVTHTMNVFGERQHPEKFIPKVIRAVLNDETVHIHSNKDRTKAGSRYWIHGRNVGAALLYIISGMENKWGWPGEMSEKFNIVGEREIDNLTMAVTIASILGKKLKYKMVDFHSSRPGHDLRYALDGSKLKNLGWEVPMNLDRGLEKTVRWTVDNPRWLEV